MIKIDFEEKPYYLKNVGEGQPYTIKTQIELDEDISGKEAIVAFIRLLNIATYRIDIQVLKDLVDDLEQEGYKENERIM